MTRFFNDKENTAENGENVSNDEEEIQMKTVTSTGRVVTCSRLAAPGSLRGLMFGIWRNVIHMQ
jgi:hypothetical protein